MDSTIEITLSDEATTEKSRQKGKKVQHIEGTVQVGSTPGGNSGSSSHSAPPSKVKRTQELKRAAVLEKEKDKALKIEDAANVLFRSEERKDTNLALDIL
ncbi:hypothetical protein BGX38DRAFT_1331425 [Terfezia claveryi]|nr:hypothetical protein BGX38DRAFT_1331425 [Terfezia claveryi]